jgi:hypothetical protein
MTDEILPPDQEWQFTYNRARRAVTDITVEPETNTIIGFERTKSGKSSDKVKRYSLDKMKNVRKNEP